jgi:hypothetical protein
MSVPGCGDCVSLHFNFIHGDVPLTCGFHS